MTERYPALVPLTWSDRDLRDLADYIRYNTEACANADLFRIDGVPLAATLEYLAQRLDEKQNDCPCIGPCEKLSLQCDRGGEEGGGKREE